MRAYLKFPFYTITFILAFSLASLPSESFAQNNLRIYDDIGGGGSTTQGSDNNDNTFIYVAGGLLIAGILAYALFIKKDNKEESDTTASLNSRLIYSENEFESANDEMVKAKDRIPVDVFISIKNNEAMLYGKTYLVGLRFKL